MNDLDRSIVATLAYYAAFGWPLTLIEICERLIPARRLGGRDIPAGSGAVLERLDRLVAMGVIAQEAGLYTTLPAEPGFGEVRIEQEKILAQKWKRMLRKARWLQVAPYVRGIYASGSLALGNTSERSDWDVFVVAQAGHLYTARICLLVIAALMRSLRTKRDKSAPDKFCFNHYVTTDGLAMRHHSLYTAHGLALLVPVYDPENYLENIWQSNQCIGQYRPLPAGNLYVRRSVRFSGVLNVFKKIFEFVLSRLESRLGSWQKRRIVREPATHQAGGRVVADDREIEFHPHSFEGVALSRYNTALEQYGLGAYIEGDSGLRT